MDIHELKNQFRLSKNYQSDNVNELMDFAKKVYIQNEISIKEYRLLVRDLEAQGAVSPDSEHIPLQTEK